MESTFRAENANMLRKTKKVLPASTFKLYLKYGGYILRQLGVFKKDKEVEMMRKLSLFLLGLLFWGAAYLTQASALQNNVEPTEEQKAEIFGNVNKDPELFSYNPLQVGNKWWRGTLGGPHYLVREVVDSLLINNHIYYEVTGLLGTGEDFWVRNEGDTTLVYDQYDDDNNPATQDLICEDFSFTGQTSVYHDFTFYYPHHAPWNCLFLDESFLIAFGVPTYLRWHQYYYPEQYNSMTIIGWARGFGMFQWTNDIPDGADISIIACKINGILYGDTSVLAEDDTTTPISNIMINCYPNPFQHDTVIKYDLPSEATDGILEILNVKGQTLRRELVRGTGVFSWNGTDKNGLSISSGMYLCKISMNSRLCKTTKLIYLK